MKVLFVNYNQLDSNSGIHVFNLANHLTLLGVECMVCTPKRASKVIKIEGALFETVEIEDLLSKKTKKNTDLIHVWTSREIVRKMTQDLLQIYSCPYVVHLEDNEQYLVSAILKIPLHIVKKLPKILLNFLIQPHMSHPKKYKEFIENATGLTVIIDRLREFCPTHILSEVIWAGYQEDLQWNMPVDLELKRSLGIGKHEFVIAYTGNAHRINRTEMAELYQAIETLYRRGISVKLIRTGTDYISFLNRKQKAFQKKYCIDLGYLPRNDLPALLSIADVLVQPGKPDAFNNYRFPSKLPEYLASGKPVILPKTNIGLYLKNYEESLFLEDGSAFDIAQKLELLFSDSNLRNKIGLGGRKFAEEHLKWGKQAEKLYSFYKTLLNQKPELVK